MRVSPANTWPLITAAQGKLVIINLQKTPIDDFAEFVIHGKCDDVVKLLMEKLQYNIPVWKKKVKVEIEVL